MYVKFPAACSATSLKLVLRGHELCEFDYVYVLQEDEETFQTKVGHRTARRDILKRELKVAENVGKCGCVGTVR